jgi:drug/metabolite transporter (DMT)-like permease
MTSRPLNRQRLGLLITIATALAYGVWPSAMRAVYADGGNAAFVVVFATIFRALPLFLTCLAQRQPLFRTRLDRRQALTGGFFQAVSSSSALAAVIFLPGPLAVVILFTHTLMLLAYMIWRGEIKPDPATLLATLAALTGLVFVLDLIHKQSSGNLIGMGLAFISAVAIATRLYVIGHQTKTRHPAAVGTENFLVAILFMPLMFFYQMPAAPHSLAGYGWMAFGTATLGLGTLGQFYAIQLLGSFRYSLFLKLEPMFATLFAALLIGEYLKPLQYSGMVLVIGSLALYQITDRRRAKNALAASEDVAP